MEYSSAVVRRFEALERARELPGGAPGLVAGEAEDRTLHVWVRFQLQLTGGIVQAARYHVFGCPHALAAADLVAEAIEGLTVDAARELSVRAVCKPLDLPVEKLGKLLRIEDALAECWRQVGT